MKNKKNGGSIFFVILAIIAVAAGVFVFLEYRDRQSIELASVPVDTQTETPGAVGETESAEKKIAGTRITWQGKEYTYNQNIRNILFIGVDKKEEMQIQDYAGRGGQADCLILLSLNTKDKTATMLNISRDSIVNLDIYDMSGDFLAEERGQIALQYAYGDGEKRSCWLQKKAVTELLHDIPINSFIALNIDGISTIADVLGGVELTVPEDYTSIDPSFVKGETIVLKGDKAERYVRYRDINEFGSNNGRMERQNQFLRALVSLLKKKVSENSAYVDTLLTAGKPFMTTDMTVDQIKELADYDLDETFIKVPGETQPGAEHDEYIIDDDNLMELLIKMFYISE